MHEARSVRLVKSLQGGRSRSVGTQRCCFFGQRYDGSQPLISIRARAYANRLRAVGHLHEAEDESQQFGDLHAAIRAAREAYQTDGTMPGGAAPDQAAKAVRQVGF